MIPLNSLSMTEWNCSSKILEIMMQVRPVVGPHMNPNISNDRVTGTFTDSFYDETIETNIAYEYSYYSELFVEEKDFFFR
jgi:hypothetical protein